MRALWVIMTFGMANQVHCEEKKDPFAEKLVKIPAGKFKMGNSLDVQLKPQELAAQEVEVAEFEIDAWATTNEEYRRFVRETKYVSDSEKFGWSFVLEYQTSDDVKETTKGQIKDATHWLAIPKAYWRAPEGPGSGVSNILDHPVTHISYNDAHAFCKWRNLRLPSESEWEYAARGGVEGKRYPWGNEDPSLNGWKMNVWQGKFPKKNKKEDGYDLTAPSKSFEPNGFGLYNVLGNVWEWTMTKYADMASAQRRPNPKDPPQRVLRGGSFLDSAAGSFNHFVDLNTRMGNTDDSASSNTGFRCAGSTGKRKPGYKYPAPKGLAGIDQEKLQKIVEEGGIEALQEYLGDKATVTTPGKLKEQQDALKKKMAELEQERKKHKIPGQAPIGNSRVGLQDENIEHIEL